MRRISSGPILFAIMEIVSSRQTGFKDYIDGDYNLTSMPLNALNAQKFTAGTIIGLVVACIVVVIGSFLVLWRLCCDYDIVTNGGVTSPLRSISLAVAENAGTRNESALHSQQLLIDDEELV